MTDLANNLEVLKSEVDQTLTKGVTFHEQENIDKEIEQEKAYQRKLRTEISAEQFAQPVKGETLRTELDEDELLKLYEERVKELELSGKPKSPKESQWYVNPSHIQSTSEAPTLQSIGRSYRYGKSSEKERSEKDENAFKYFPNTFGSSYEMCALDYPASAHMDSSAPPSMRTSRSKSASRLTQSYTFRTPDRSFKDHQALDKMYLMTSEAPVTSKNSFNFLCLFLYCCRCLIFLNLDYVEDFLLLSNFIL
ncbi:hypothetical protein DPMN_046147 [Dreissena polymorpha]|uniref:Uncharacterized protein n=1 Tax=Dreissena polymorpha TaxID=45954 RepID=A0A9D4HXY7_DREPO|nr:hypothetical protein DPMN_046147 [Dreissena polymorpha]